MLDNRNFAWMWLEFSRFYGAKSFILQCLSELWEALLRAHAEIRFDSAFSSEQIVDALDTMCLEG